jgi:methionyl-tRNA formyltransferase
MKILLLGPPESVLIDFLNKVEDELITSENKIDTQYILKNNIDFIVCHGYRHLIGREILETMTNRIINLHISILPFNKGADPNFWSFIEDSPKGVTIHVVDEGLDTGDILLQKHIDLSDSDNLKVTYSILQNSIQSLFMLNWLDLKMGKIKPKKQIGKGTFHKSADKEKYISSIKDSWLDMPIEELKDYIAHIKK